MASTTTPKVLLCFGAILDGFYRCDFQQPFRDIQWYFGDETEERDEHRFLENRRNLTNERREGVVRNGDVLTIQSSTDDEDDDGAFETEDDNDDDDNDDDDDEEEEEDEENTYSGAEITFPKQDIGLSPKSSGEGGSIDDNSITDSESSGDEGSEDEESVGTKNRSSKKEGHSSKEFENDLSNVEYIYREILGYQSLYDDKSVDSLQTNEDEDSVLTELLSVGSGEAKEDGSCATDEKTVYTTGNIRKILEEFRSTNSDLRRDGEYREATEDSGDDESEDEIDEEGWPQLYSMIGLGSLMKYILSEDHEKDSVSSPRTPSPVHEDSGVETVLPPGQPLRRQRSSALRKAKKFFRIGSDLKREGSLGVYSVDTIDTQDLSNLLKQDLEGNSRAMRVRTLNADAEIPKKTEIQAIVPCEKETTGPSEKDNRLLRFVQRLKGNDMQKLRLAVQRFEQRERQHLKNIAGRFRNFHFNSEKRLRRTLAKLRREQLKRLMIVIAKFQVSHARSLELNPKMKAIRSSVFLGRKSSLREPLPVLTE